MKAALPALLLSAAAFLAAGEGGTQPPGTAASEGAGRFAPGLELPEGDGKQLLETACTTCHDLAGLSAYEGYWGRERWASMVVTMIDHGAELDESQAETVVEYLTTFFGPASRPSNGG